MALEVEDGTGKANAESYLSETDADTYHVENNNTAWASLPTPVKEAALREATRWLDGRYLGQWIGTRGSATQALEWPRSEAYADDGLLVVDATTLPAALLDATAEAALRASTDTLAPDLVRGGEVSRKKVVAGPVEVDTTYSTSAQDFTEFQMLDATVKRLLRGGSSGGSQFTVVPLLG